MVRRVVTAYLILAALIGPGLCYCTPLRLLSCSHRQHHPSPPKENKPNPQPSDCRCQHQHHVEPHAPAVPHCPEENAPACPCHHHAYIPVALIASGEGASLHLMLSHSEFAVGVAVVPFLTDDVLPADRWPSYESLSSPFQTAVEILRALQTMRC